MKKGTLFKKKIFKYIKCFGLYNGLYIFLKVRRSSKTGLISFSIPGLKEPVFLRRQSSDFSVFEEIYIDQQYAINFQKESIKTIIDAGANIGLSALYFLKKYPSATIICLEPEDTNFELLQKNVGGYCNILIIKKGLWHSNERLNFINPEAEKWSFELKAANKDDGGIEGISINDIITDYNLSGIDLLKIDIEGSEKEVFGLNTAWINKVKHIIVEIHENMRPGAYQAVMKLALDNKFNCTHQSAQYFFSMVNEQNS